MDNPAVPRIRSNRRSAGVVVARRFPEGWRLLLLRAFRNWDFPKGGIEQGETPLAAAIRETAEETGLTGLDFRFGEDYRDTAPYGHGKVARYFLAVSDSGRVWLPVSAQLGRPEHEEFRWVSPERAKAMLPARLQDVLAWAAQRLAQQAP